MFIVFLVKWYFLLHLDYSCLRFFPCPLVWERVFPLYIIAIHDSDSPHWNPTRHIFLLWRNAKAIAGDTQQIPSEKKELKKKRLASIVYCIIYKPPWTIEDRVWSLILGGGKKSSTSIIMNREITTYICSLWNLPFLFLVCPPCGSA